MSNEPTGLFLACYNIASIDPEAPNLSLSLAVNAVTQRVTGHAQLRQPVAPPAGNLSLSVQGSYFDGDGRVLAYITGFNEMLPIVPPGMLPIMPVLLELWLDLDGWKAGKGSTAHYRYRWAADQPWQESGTQQVESVSCITKT